MSDVQIQDDASFDAEIEAAKSADMAYDGEQDLLTIEEGDEQEPEKAPEPTLEDRLAKAEKIAQDKNGALKAERAKAREYRERADKLEARLAALEGGSKKADEIDFSTLKGVEEDPIGNIEAVRRLAEQMMAERRSNGVETEQQRQFQQINTRMTEYESDYRAENPDYDDAAKFFREARQAELEEQGYSGQELQRQMTNELVGMVARAMHSEKDPAEVVYKLAQKRGFGAKSTLAVDESAKKLQTVARGQNANRSLSSAGGKTGDGELTPGTVYKLDGAAFDAAFAKLRKQQRG